MDDNEFLRGIEGEQQGGQDLVSGAEHLIRLKKQVGITRPNDDLELEKEAGELAESLATPSLPPCKNCGKAKTACMCGEKQAGLGEVLEGAKTGLKFQATGVGVGLKGLKTPGSRSGAAGLLAGMAAPAAAVGGAAYLAGKHSREKTATPLESILLNARIKTASLAAVGPPTTSNLAESLNIKLAEVREKTANAIVDRLKDVNPGLVAATGMGALAGGIGTYLSSRPQKDSGKSKAEEELGGKVEAHKGQPERGLLSKMHNRNTELEHGYAQAFREHPAKAALIGAITGGMGGYGIGRLAGGVSKLRGGK
jgi:hypothetical protein